MFVFACVCYAHAQGFTWFTSEASGASVISRAQHHGLYVALLYSSELVRENSVGLSPHPVIQLHDAQNAFLLTLAHSRQGALGHSRGDRGLIKSGDTGLQRELKFHLLKQ